MKPVPLSLTVDRTRNLRPEKARRSSRVSPSLGGRCSSCCVKAPPTIGESRRSHASKTTQRHGSTKRRLLGFDPGAALQCEVLRQVLQSMTSTHLINPSSLSLAGAHHRAGPQGAQNACRIGHLRSCRRQSAGSPPVSDRTRKRHAGGAHRFAPEVRASGCGGSPPASCCSAGRFCSSISTRSAAWPTIHFCLTP